MYTYFYHPSSPENSKLFCKIRSLGIPSPPVFITANLTFAAATVFITANLTFAAVTVFITANLTFAATNTRGSWFAATQNQICCNKINFAASVQIAETKSTLEA